MDSRPVHAGLLAIRGHVRPRPARSYGGINGRGYGPEGDTGDLGALLQTKFVTEVGV